MDILFLGAAREVTGSCFMLTANEKRILIDCGMEQGKDTYENQKLPVSASEIDCVVLTHAHIDHSGMLPLLYKNGFRGPIYATHATIDLCDIMLRDSAYIQESEAEWRNRKSKRSGTETYVPLYTQEDAIGTVNLMKEASYTEEIEILPGIRIKMTDAGHLLGSASVTFLIEEGENIRRVVFSGDIGNTNQPILKDPIYLTQADVVIMESTYGDRLHKSEFPDYISDLVDTLQTTFDRGGNVVIPSFAVGRTQDILYFLREIKEKNLVKGHEGFPVYMDSPLAIRATNIFDNTGSQFFDDDMNALIAKGINPIHFDDLRLCSTVEESKKINFETRPCVIISASGMCEAGRIRHHLKHNLWKENATILFVGYQSVGTLGRKIVDGARKVKLFGEEIAINAEIRTLNAKSGHADRKGLKKWVDSFSPKPEFVYIVHGDEESALSFAELLKDDGYKVNVPYSGDRWDIIEGVALEHGPRKLAKKKPKKERIAVADADRMLREAMLKLQALIDRGSGWSNGIKRQIARQIEKLVRKWE
ncbi:MAG: MBL fold metallo-hydrolase [Christensenellaceae bacterium]|nr:MBL fold metallo-hydrolase [Christensenellaceae bacterium]